jgi:hypothetical protein
MAPEVIRHCDATRWAWWAVRDGMTLSYRSGQASALDGSKISAVPDAAKGSKLGSSSTPAAIAVSRTIPHWQGAVVALADS